MTANAPNRPRATRVSAAAWLVGVSAVATALSGCGGTTQADGRSLFAANCAVCHGPSGGGTEQAPPLTDARYLPDRLSDAEIATSIRNGVAEPETGFGPMPAFSRFDDDQVAALVEVVRELQGGSG